MKYGYARVSTDDRKAGLQTAALKGHAFTDTATGASSKRQSCHAVDCQPRMASAFTSVFISCPAEAKNAVLPKGVVRFFLQRLPNTLLLKGANVCPF